VRALRLGLAALAWGALGVLAFAGVALSAFAVYASTPMGRRLVASAVIRQVSREVAGTLKLGGLDLEPGGAVVIRDFEAYDPDGHLVLQVDRLVVSADVTRLRNQVVGLDVELLGARLLVGEDEMGRLSLVRAFAPAHPSTRREPEPERKGTVAPWRNPLSGWTIRLHRLTVRGTSVSFQDATGVTRYKAQDLSLDARAILGPRRGRVELALRGEAVSPVPGVLSLDLRALLDRDELHLPVLRAELGGTAVAAMAEADLAQRTGRAALTRATVDRAQARELVKDTPPGADLAFDAYAEADGQVATVALHLEPRSEQGAAGSDAAAALRVDGPKALGFDLALRALDPSAILAALPAGRLTVTARGGLSGESLASARGNLDLSLASSRLGSGELGPASAAAQLDRGRLEVSRLSLLAPGVRVDGSGSYEQKGAASARLTAQVDDLARALANVGKLVGTELPPFSGRARIEAGLSGSAAAPVLNAEVSSPDLSIGDVAGNGIEARVEASSPFWPGRHKVEVRIDHLVSGDMAIATRVALDGTLAPATGGAGFELSASGEVPSLGNETVSVGAEGTLPADVTSLRLSELTLGWPGSPYALQAPATITFEGPRVDRFALASGPKRIVLEGGIGPGTAVDAHLELSEFDVTSLPPGLLPTDLGIAGVVSLDARATGSLARPNLEGQFAVKDGAFRTEHGCHAEGTLRYDGRARRATVELGLLREETGSVDIKADIPFPLSGRPAEPVSASLDVASVPIPALLDLADVSFPASGQLSVKVEVSGTAGMPAVSATIALEGGTFRDLQGIGLSGTVEARETGEAVADLELSGQPAARVEGKVPLSTAAMMADPARALEGLREALFEVDVSLPGLDLALLSGRLGVPEGLEGSLRGEVHARGRPEAPRGTVALALARGAYAGYKGLSATVDAQASDDRVEARVAGRLGDDEVLRLSAALGGPPEQLVTRTGLETAPLLVQATAPGVDLASLAAPWGATVSGRVDLELHAEGSLGRPAVRLEGLLRSLSVQGRSVGEVRLSARAGQDGATGEIDFEAPAGGKLSVTAKVESPISIETGESELREANAEVKVRADAVELGFLPGVLPTVVRSASGRLDADVTAAGPLAELTPRGTMRLSGGRLGLLDWGEWSGIAFDATATRDTVEIRSLEIHRRDGTLQLHAALNGLSSPVARLDGRLDLDKLTVSHAGSDLATVTFGVQMSGTYKERRLDARLDLPEGLVRLADKLPRDLQSLEQRPDVLVGPRPPPKPSHASAGKGSDLFAASVRLVAPGKFIVRRENPRVRLELKADVTYEHEAGSDLMSGSVEVVRGSVEPLTDRRFDVKRGRLTFTGGPPKAAVIDAEALYQNPTANVTVTVSGPLVKPEINLKSEPPLDQGQIAMLIATGQTDIAPRGGASAAAQADLGRTAASKVGFTVFNTFIRDQLDLGVGDVTLDSSAAKVSGYIPDTKLYVGFTRRFDANRQLGENDEEVQVEYAVTPHWMLSGRWGNYNTGEASLLWSRDY